MAERERRLARLFRAESLLTQAEVEERTGIDRVTLAHYESGRETPTPEHLERLAAIAGLTVAAGEELLALSATLRRPRRRAGREAGDLFEELGDTRHAERAWQRFLRLDLPDPEPAAEDRVRALEQLDRLRALPERQRLSVVRVALDFQTLALAEQAAEASAAAGNPEEARAWAELAAEVRRRVGA